MGTHHTLGFLLLPALVACNQAPVGVDPSTIRLSTALRETVDALYEMQAASRQHPERRSSGALGINVCTVTATFNVTAGGTQNNELVVALGTPPAAPVSLNLTGTAGQTVTASRGNQIAVSFTSPACNPDGTLGSTHPGRVLELEQQIEAVRSRGPGTGRAVMPRV